MSARAFDLAVIGAGPAGCAAALAAAADGLSVVVVNPRSDTGDQPCGEGLLPAGVDVLHELGLAALLQQAHRFDRLRYCVPGAPPFEVALSRPGAALMRRLLMHGLDQTIARRPEIRRLRQRVDTERLHTGFRLRGGADAEGVEVRTLLVPDGRGGSAAAWLRILGVARTGSASADDSRSPVRSTRSRSTSRTNARST